MNLSLSMIFLLLVGCSKTSTTTKRNVSSNGAPYSFELNSNKENKNVPVYVIGGDANSFVGVPSGEIITDSKSYDVAIVGGGLAGLASAIYLSDHGKKVLLLEKEEHLGGLAASGKADGTTYDRGAAYWTGAYQEEMEILKHIGIADYEERHPIEEPIDSYLWKGKLYLGIWEHETLHHLPITFSIFKKELELASDTGLIPDQPFEEYDKRGGKMDLDKFTAQEWVRGMACANEKRAKAKDREAKKLAQKLIKEKGAFDCAKGLVDKRMDDVIDLLDVYSRSALGSETPGISAMVFANFYISEITTRYTAPEGTGRAADSMVEMLRNRSKLVKIKTKSTVSSVVQNDKGVEVTYVVQDEDGNRTTVKSSATYAVYAAQLRVAPKILAGFKEKSPEQSSLMENLGYSHYSVHNAVVKGHPFRATYDTWVRAADYTNDDFTDIILGRWMELKGYEGYRDFSKNPPGNSIVSIYQPLPQKWIGKSYNDLESAQLAEQSVRRTIELMAPALKQQNKASKNLDLHMEFISVKTSRWPFSVHVAAPGHFTKRAKILRQPFGRVFFANNNLGTPSFEEALFRGHCAANNIMTRYDSKFKNEEWSNCPIDL